LKTNDDQNDDNKNSLNFDNNNNNNNNNNATPSVEHKANTTNSNYFSNKNLHVFKQQQMLTPNNSIRQE
jgi:hypothetical protein